MRDYIERDVVDTKITEFHINTLLSNKDDQGDATLLLTIKYLVRVYFFRVPITSTSIYTSISTRGINLEYLVRTKQAWHHSVMKD